MERIGVAVSIISKTNLLPWQLVLHIESNDYLSFTLELENNSISLFFIFCSQLSYTLLFKFWLSLTCISCFFVRLKDVLLDTSSAGSTSDVSITGVEKCSCPRGYTGLSCEVSTYLRLSTSNYAMPKFLASDSIVINCSLPECYFLHLIVKI